MKLNILYENLFLFLKLQRKFEKRVTQYDKWNSQLDKNDKIKRKSDKNKRIRLWNL